MRIPIVCLIIFVISACSLSNQQIQIVDHQSQIIDENLKLYLENRPKVANYESIIGDIQVNCEINSDNRYTNCVHPDEIKYIQSVNGEWPPKLGLALSGGGTRAASYSIGVLKALNETGVLDKVDIISSVSGGSYASYWFYSQLYYKNKLQDALTRIEKTEKTPTSLEYNRDDMFRSWNDLNEEIEQTNLEDPGQYRFQRTLEESSDILAYTHKPSFVSDIAVGFQYATQLALQFLTIPFHWVAGGLFDWEINMTPFFYYYKDGLERSYGYVPLDYSMEYFANARPQNFLWLFNTVDNIDAEPIMLHEMKTFLNENKDNNQKIPTFIINATAKFGSEIGGYNKVGGRTMENSVFEFTPWSCYSPLLYDEKPIDLNENKNVTPYCPEDFRINSPSSLSFNSQDLDLARIVTISGAAVDGQVQSIDIGGEVKNDFTFIGKSGLDLALDVTNFNMGYHVTNPNSNWLNNVGHKLLPWPLYIGHDYLTEDSPTSLYLTDGGFSDNLGLFPLIRRGVKNIIVVDSEQDGKSIFEAAKRINKTLKKYALELTFDGCEVQTQSVQTNTEKTHEIADFKLRFEHKKKECALLITHLVSAPKQWTISGFNKSGEFISKEINSINSDLSKELAKVPIDKKKVIQLSRLEIDLSQNQPINVRNTSIKNAVLFGTISGKNITEELNVIYIKLAAPSTYNQENKWHGDENLPYTVSSYMATNPGFPHQPTADIFYSVDQFRAYRDLGYIVTKTCFKKGGQCKQF